MSNGTLAMSMPRVRWPWLLSCALLLLMMSAAATPAAPADEQPAQDSAAKESAENGLTIEAAVSLATSAADPSVTRFSVRAQALDSEAVADSQLPDPMVSAQVMNVPVDTFSLDQEGMTQALRLGLRQEFPAGRTLDVRGRQRNAEAEAERARRDEALRRIALETRTAWLELAWQRRAVDVLQQSRGRIEQQIESLQSRFATGG